MCGIVTYLGKREALPLLLEGLKRLEYRGYDSAGIAVANGGVRTAKAIGKIVNLEKTASGIKGKMGIAHTRWATHGQPTKQNAHPHQDETGRVFVVHNGIIENYQLLRKELEGQGRRFSSETDTEVLPHLIAGFLAQGTDLTTAVQSALRRVTGTFGIAVIDRDTPGVVVLAKRGSPLVIGIGDGEILGASDVSAFARLTKQVVYLDDNDVATLRADEYTIVSLENKAIERQVQTIDSSEEDLNKEGYKHFMLKEIEQQPQTVRNALRGRLLLEEGAVRLGGVGSVLDRLKSANRFSIVSCGTSYYAGLYGRYVFEALTRTQIDTALASEFRYRSIRFDQNSVVLAISQSGETADTLAALREAKRKGALVLGIVNVVGSSIARETGAGVYMYAGPEIGVASTKCFMSQGVILTLLALLLGRYQDVGYNDGLRLLRGLESLPEQIESILARKDEVRALAEKYRRFENFLFIGRKYNFPIALEGALKLKEVSYIHAEGYAAGEMKHGPIALIDKDFPTVAIAPQDETYDKMVSNIQEIRARKGPVLAIATQGDEKIREHVDDVFHIPAADALISPLLAAVPLQLLAYYIADLRGCEIDKPRNLAKCVTVE